jgi:hypothetical protein
MISEAQHSTSKVEAAFQIPRSTLTWLGDRLPVTRHGRPGKARYWSIKDVCVIYVAQKITDRGILPAAAVDMASEVEKQFQKIAIDQEEIGATYYLAALLKPNSMGRYESIITKDTEAALAFVERGGAAVFNLTKMLTEAVTILREHEEAKGGHNA